MRGSIQIGNPHTESYQPSKKTLLSRSIPLETPFSPGRAIRNDGLPDRVAARKKAWSSHMRFQQILQSTVRAVRFGIIVTIASVCSSAHAVQPLPPLMKTLMQVFPEQDGWFVEAPAGTVPGIPEAARAFFECPRVIVPEYHKIDLAAGKVVSAEVKLSTRKITRYDHKPGAPGLPGLRGVWCAAEVEPSQGFLLLTPHENRYLLWARQSYFPSFAVDSIQPKFRDAYARAVSDHLTAVDYGVPTTVSPRAVERNLPSWMDLYPDTAEITSEQITRFDSLMAGAAEMKLWGCAGFTEVAATQAAVDRFVGAATDTLFQNLREAALQTEYQGFLKSGIKRAPIITLTSAGFDSLAPGWYIFGVDEYRRVRIARTIEPSLFRATASQTAKSPSLSNHALLFPGQPLLAAGSFDVALRDSKRSIRTVTIWSDHIFFSPASPSVAREISERSDAILLSLGHLFACLKDIGVSLDGVRIRKF